MKYYKLYIELFLVSLIVSDLLESDKLPASPKLPFIPYSTHHFFIYLRNSFIILF